MSTPAQPTAPEPFEWEGYCTRCQHGVSLEDGSDTPETEREAVCFECDKILCREEGSAEARAEIVAWLRGLAKVSAGQHPVDRDDCCARRRSHRASGVEGRAIASGRHR